VDLGISGGGLQQARHLQLTDLEIRQVDGLFELFCRALHVRPDERDAGGLRSTLRVQIGDLEERTPGHPPRTRTNEAETR